MEVFDHKLKTSHRIPVAATDPSALAKFLLDWLASNLNNTVLDAIAHRIVHGGRQFNLPTVINQALIEDLKKVSALAPAHLPIELLFIEETAQRYPKLKQVACFDTGFHAAMPQEAKLLPIPRKYFLQGVQRYGFHGLSYSYLLEELKRCGEVAASRGRIVMAHLGNGASMTAVKDGVCVDTSMAFTPLGGLVMSTRSGDLDPGLLYYLGRKENMSVEALYQMLSRESGLLGLSETSSDVRDLLNLEDSDIRAREALAVFCYQAKKWIGALSAAMGGIDVLVFSGGIGENSNVIRDRICSELNFLGVELVNSKNEKHEYLISKANSKVRVYCIKTDEEVLMARFCCKELGLT